MSSSSHRLCPNSECELYKRTHIFGPQSQFCPECRTPLQEDPRIFAGKYLLGELIGKGGMGEVYQAWQPRLDRKVAIKKLAPHLRAPALAGRLIEEAQIAGSLQHPCIVVIHDAAAYGEEPYLCMEHLAGETLSALIAREGAQPPTRVLELLSPVAKALTLAHQRGIEHRDLKPDNLFLVHDGTAERLKLLDFGISRSRSDELRPTNQSTEGTECYAPPEQLVPGTTRVHGRADVFALGVTLYEALTSRRPFEVSTRSALLRPPRSLRDRRPGVPRALDELVGRMLLGDPAARPTMAEVTAALAHLRQQQKPWRLLLGVGLGLCLTIGVTAWWVIPQIHRPPPLMDLYGRALSVLSAELGQQDPLRRRLALDGLGVSRDRDLRHLAQPLLRDPDQQVCGLAEDISARLDGPLAANAADRDLLQQVQRDPQRRRRPEVAAAFLRAARRLTEADDEAGREVLVKLLDQPLDPPQRQTVLLSLARSTDSEAQARVARAIAGEPDLLVAARLRAAGGDCQDRERLRRISRQVHSTVREQELGARGLAECGTLAEDGPELARFLLPTADARLRPIAAGAVLRLATRDRPVETDAARVALDLDRLLGSGSVEDIGRALAGKGLNPQQQRDLVSELRYRGGPQEALPLQKLLRAGDVDLRLRAAGALRALLQRCGRSETAQACQRLQEDVRTLLSDRDQGVRVTAASALPVDSDTSRVISEGLDATNARVRELAVAATSAEHPALLRVLGDSDEPVRFRAALRLAEQGTAQGLGRKQVITILDGTLAHGNAEQALRAWAALRRIGKEPPLPSMLQGGWDGKDLALRFLVISAAAQMPPEEALRYLRQGVRDPAAAVRRLVAEVAFLFLKEQHLEEARGLLLVLRGDSDMSVRRRVLAMLLELLDTKGPETTGTGSVQGRPDPTPPSTRPPTPAAVLLKEADRARERGDLRRAQELLQQVGALLVQQPRQRGRWLCLRGQVAEMQADRGEWGEVQKYLDAALGYYDKVLQLPDAERYGDDLKQAVQRRDQVRTRVGQVRVTICCPGQPEHVEYLAPRQYTRMICGVQTNVVVKPGSLRLGKCTDR